MTLSQGAVIKQRIPLNLGSEESNSKDETH